MVRRYLVCWFMCLSVGLSAGVSAGQHVALSFPATEKAPLWREVANGNGIAGGPLMFIENAGQWDAAARFAVNISGGTIFLAEDGIWITVMDNVKHEQRGLISELTPREGSERPLPRRRAAVKIGFAGANAHPRLEPLGRLDTHLSFFKGGNPGQWQRDVPVWSGVRYVGVYQGVDLEISSDNGRFAWRLVGSYGFLDQDALASVELAVEGADGVAVEDDLLRLHTDVGDLALPLLSAGMTVGRQPIATRSGASFAVVWPFAVSQSPVALAIADNSSRLLFGTFLLGGQNPGDGGNAIVLDSTGNVYVTGSTTAVSFPTSAGTSTTFYPDQVYAAKLNPTGTTLLFGAILAEGSGKAIALDGGGSVYLTGLASQGFPTTPGAIASCQYGAAHSFVAKLSPSGTDLTYSTCLSGTYYMGYPRGIAVDPGGDAYVAGTTATDGQHDDAFVAKVNATGTALVYSLFIGGSEYDSGYGIALDEAGNAYVAGQTNSYDFPTTPGAFNTGPSYSEDAFVAKVNAEGTGLVYSGRLGGLGNDSRANGIAIDDDGNAYVTGATTAPDFPTTPGAFQTTYHYGPNGFNSGELFVTKLDASGTGLVYSTFLGGTGGEEGYAVAIDTARNAYVTGQTASSDFPTSPDAFDNTYVYNDAFVSVLGPAGDSLLYSSYFGGANTDAGYSVVADGSCNAHVTGQTLSLDFPITPGAYDTRLLGAWRGFVVKMASGPCYRATVPVVEKAP